MSNNSRAGRRALLLALLLPALAHAQVQPLTLTSPNPESFGRFGSSVSGVPDADGDGRGDGRGDLLIGALNESGSAMATPR